MFGYIMPAKPELKVKEYESYRAMYCGLCMQLKEEYGLVSRFFLNYDLVLVALLADGLSGEAGKPCLKRCMANPRKRCMQTATDGLRLAATAQVLLCWYKLSDNVQDESFFKKLAAKGGQLLLKGAYRRAAEKAPELDECLAQQMQRQVQLEESGCTSADEAAEPTGFMTAAILSKCIVKPAQQHIIERLGLFLGKIIYWLDAAEDYEKDKQQNRYNVFLRKGLTKEETVLQTQQLCRMATGEIARCYHLLDFELNRPILENIIFLGLAISIGRAGQQPQHKNNEVLA